MTVLSDLAARGLTLALNPEGRLLARPKSRLDEPARRLIDANRAALTVALANRRTLAAFLLDWMPGVYPDGYFLAGPDPDFWAALETDLNRHADDEAPAAFAVRVGRWRAGASQRFAAFADPAADPFGED